MSHRSKKRLARPAPGSLPLQANTAQPLAPSPARALQPIYRRRLFPSAEWISYAAVLAVTLLIMVVNLQLWRLNLTSPFGYDGDGMLHLVFTKAFVENGWFLRNPWLGAPDSMLLYEFPAADTLPGVIIKVIGLFTHDAGLINNVFYLLTYPLSSLIGFAVCRRLGISRGPAALAGVLYAFLPYHFWRGTAHLYLSAYFVAPLAVLVGWWIASGRLFPGERGAGRPWRLLTAVVLTLIVSTAGVYYPFFAGFLLGAATLLALCARRDWRHFLAGGFLCAVLVAGMLACLIPTIAYVRTHHHPPASARASGEAEIYGLKIIQLILPIDGHRLHSFAAAKNRYNVSTPLVTENTSAAMGGIAAVGFLLLIGWLVFRPPLLTPVAAGPASTGDDPAAGDGFDHRQILDTFSSLNAVMVLFGTIGGFGSLFAFFISPQVRSLNRISVFIAFLSLAALAAGLDRWIVRRRPYPVAVRCLGWAVIGLLLAAGVLDQSVPQNVSYLKAGDHEYRADRAFFRQVAAASPADGMIYQLPYCSFPESGGVFQMPDYSHFRGYIQTNGLRWSYGAMRNSPADRWQAYIAALPIDVGLRQLALSGFTGIYLDRNGYADNGAAMENDLRRLLGPPAAFRLRRLFFSLEEYTRSLRATMSPQRWQEESDLALHAPLVNFDTSFSRPETDSAHTWRWAGQDSKISVSNTSALTRRVRLRMLVQTGVHAPAHLTMSGSPGTWTWTINDVPQPITADLDVPPGDVELRFHCDGQPIAAPGDVRSMVWSPIDFRLDDAGLPPAVSPEVRQP